MTTTPNNTAATNSYPDIPVPLGADFADDWQPERYRMVYGRRRDVAGEIEVSTSLEQLADGTINRSSERGGPPLVHVHTTGACGLTTEQARALIGEIRDAVDELDGRTR